MLQIKGLAMSPNLHLYHQSHHNGQKSPSSPLTNPFNSSTINALSNAADNYPMNLVESKMNLGVYNSTSMQKQSSEFSTGAGPSGESSYHKRQLKRSSDSVDNDISAESMENTSSDDVPPIPQISMIESSRFDLSSVKREANESNQGTSFNFGDQFNINNEHPNEIHMNNDLMRGGGSSAGTSGGNGNHMDIPSGKQSFNSFI